MLVVINKIPLLLLCREELGIGYGRLDYHDLLDGLCEHIDGSAKDRSAIRDMAFGDLYFQDHSEVRLTEAKKHRLWKVLSQIRSMIVRDIISYSRTPRHAHFKFEKNVSRMSLTFKVF